MTHASRSAVIDRCSKDRVEIAGFGFATFVKKGFAEKEVRNPKPGLNGRILESIGSRDSVVATYEEVRDANTRGDLEPVILDISWKQTSLSASEVDEVRVMLGRSYQELYAGYHFSRILLELVDALDAWHVQGQRNIRILDRFESRRLANPEAIWNSDRALAAVTVESTHLSISDTSGSGTSDCKQSFDLLLSATLPEEPDQTSRSSCHASEGECPQQSRLLR